MKKISFVIPVYNSEQTIADVVRGIEQTARTLSEYNIEVILVNDYSRDNSWAELKRLAHEKSFVKSFCLSKNYGQSNAIMAGFNHVTGDYVICLDDDMQTPPEEFPKLLQSLIENDFDVVFGHYGAKKHAAWRNLGSKFNNLMARSLTGMPVNVYPSSYFCVRRYVVDEVIKYKNPYPYLGGLFFRVTINVGNCEINHRQREIGKSNYSMKKLITLWLNGFTSFSVKPLRIASFMGFIITAISFIAAIILITLKLIDPASIQAGWTSTLVIILLVGGIQLIFIGLLGEYIGRSYLCLNKTPQYVIRESITGVKDEDN